MPADEREEKKKIRVLVVDDRPAITRALKARLGLEADVEVVGEAEDGRAAVELVLALRPDVVVMDLLMPAMDGIEATVALGVAAPQTAVVMLTLYDDAGTERRAFAAGAAGFVGKHRPEGELVEGIRRAAPRRLEAGERGAGETPRPGQTPISPPGRAGQ